MNVFRKYASSSVYSKRDGMSHDSRECIYLHYHKRLLPHLFALTWTSQGNAPERGSEIENGSQELGYGGSPKPLPYLGRDPMATSLIHCEL